MRLAQDRHKLPVLVDTTTNSLALCEWGDIIDQLMVALNKEKHSLWVTEIRTDLPNCFFLVQFPSKVAYSIQTSVISLLAAQHTLC